MFPTLIRISVVTGIFITLIIGISFIELTKSYQTTIQSTYDRANLTGFLVSEWIAESFSNIHYLLQDVSNNIEQSQIAFPTAKPTTRDQINKGLLHKTKYNKNILFFSNFRLGICITV